MTKYFFDYFDGKASYVDEYGVILNDLHEVAGHAVGLFREILIESFSEVENRLLSITVHSESGVRVYYAQVSVIASFVTCEDGADRIETSSRRGEAN